MRRILLSLLALAASLALGVWFAQATGLAAGPPPPPPTLSYRVSVEPDSGFAVQVRASGLRGRRPQFHLLEGWGLLQNQSAHLRDLRVRDEAGRPVAVEMIREPGETRWRLDHRHGGDVILTYTVLPYDPDLSPESSFIDGKRFVLLGYSLFLVPTGISAFDPAPIDVQVRAPRGWKVWSSWPGGGTRFRPPSLHDLWSGIAAGGAFGASRVQAGPVAVTVLTQSPIPDLIGLGVANRLFPALRELVSYFGAPPRGDSLSVLALYRVGSPREATSSLSGCSEESAFLCLASGDRFRDVEGLTTLAVHECVHFYLGGAVSADGEPPYRNSPDLVWLLEGVTEYLTYRLLEVAGSLPPGESERVALRKEREMLAAPDPNLSLADAARRMESTETYMLVYSRGYLVARLLEKTMEEASPDCFAGALRDLFETHNFYREQRTITPDVVRSVFEARCPGISSFLDRYATGSETLPRVKRSQETGGAG